MENDKLILSDEDKRSILRDVETERQKVRDFRLQRNSILETDAPDDVAYDLKKSQELGVPRIAIAGDRDRFRREDEVSKQRAYRESAPRFSEWLDNPDNYAVARDDTESMGILERSLSWAGSTLSGIGKQSLASGEKIGKGTLSNIQNAMSEEEQLAHRNFYIQGKGAGFAFYQTLPGFEAKRDIAAKRHGYDSPEYKAATMDIVKFWQSYYDKQRGYEGDQERFMENYRAVQAVYERKAPKGDGIVQRTMFGAVDSLAMSVPAIVGGTATALTTRNPALAATVGTGLFTGPIYGEEIGRGKAAGLSDDEAISRARKMTLIEAATERVALGHFFDGSKGFMRRMAGFALRDQLGEQIATASQDAVELNYLDKDKTLGQYWSERPQAALETALTTLWMSGGMGAIQLSAETAMTQLGERAKRALMTDGEKAVGDMLDAAEKSALRARSPEKFQDALERIADKTDAETMVVDLDGLAEALKQSDVDLREAAAEFGATPEELQQAFDMGGEFSVKTAALLNSKLARENREALQDNVRLESDPLTPAQRRKKVEAFNTEMVSELNRLGENIKDAVTREDMELQVRELIAKQIAGTDFYTKDVVAQQARMMEALISTLATRLGITPVEAFQQLAPRLRGVVAGEVREADVLGDVAEDVGADTTQSLADELKRVKAEFDEASKALASLKGFDEQAARRRAEDNLPSDLAQRISALEEKLQKSDLSPEEDAALDAHLDEARAIIESVVRKEKALAGDEAVKSGQERAKMLADLERTHDDAVADILRRREALKAQGDMKPDEAEIGPAALEQMGGAKAKTADLDALSKAQSMAESGASRDQIWTETGWFQGVDEQWRFEISDDTSASRAGEWGFVTAPDGTFSMNKPAVNGELSDALAHDQLFEAYPELAKVLTSVGEGELTGVRLPILKKYADLLGRSDQDNVAKVTIDAKDGIRSGLLHEGQHLIQDKEGFALGGSPMSVRLDDALSKVIEEAADKIYAERSKVFPDYSRSQAVQVAAEDVYNRLAGEVEARAVEKRMDMTPEERRARPPWLDYDVPEADQILRFSEKDTAPDVKKKKLFGLFQKQGKRPPRGVFDPTRNEITLFEGTNLSTLMHEAAHWYFDTLLRLEADGNAPAFITKQLDEVFKWGGVARGTAIYDENGEPTEQGRELHETFAETFEVYLQDGKAPSAKLRDVFRAFKAWLTQLYRKQDPRTRANLTPEIREVFDRMLAVDDQITAATKQFEQTAEQMAQSLLDRGIITKRQFKNAKKRLGDAREKAKEELMARLMDDVTRTEKQWWNSELSRVKGEVIREFDRSPVGRAMAWLGEGVYKGDVAEGKVPQGEALLYQAREAGYQGESMGEAVEWLRAKAKGLDISTEARMKRAPAMGFDTETKLYHGTAESFQAFDKAKAGGSTKAKSARLGTWLSDSPSTAKGYADLASEKPVQNLIDASYAAERNGKWDDAHELMAKAEALEAEGGSGQTIMPVYIRGKVKSVDMDGAMYDPDDHNLSEMVQIAKSEGYDGLRLVNFSDEAGYGAYDAVNHTVIFDPSNIRSVHAAFDPDFSDSANLLAQKAGEMTRKQFQSEYMQHIDLRGRGAGDQAETAKLISEEGMREGFNTNLVRPYQGGQPKTVTDVNYAPKKGDYIYLVPKSHWTDTPNGPKSLAGYKPKPEELLIADKDYPDVYELYLAKSRGANLLAQQAADIGAARRQLSDDSSSLDLDESAAASINPIYRPEVLPPQRMKGSNREAAQFLEDTYTDEPITDFTAEISPERLDRIATQMAAETQLALASTGNAFDWYSAALDRTLSVAAVKYPMLTSDAAAQEAGLGTAANARFLFTYIMATTSQNLDVSANAKATDAAFGQMIDRWRAGNYTMDTERWGTGDKKKAMNINFAKFNEMLPKMPGKTVVDQLAAMDELFRASRTVSEWTAAMKAAGIPYSPPGQTAKDAIVYGSSTLGPKIGNGFWQNLNGNFDPLTIDLWMRRTWGRFTGKSIGLEEALPGQRKRLKAAVKRSRSKQTKTDEYVASLEAELAGVRQQLEALSPKAFATKKTFNAEKKRLKAEEASLTEIVADAKGVKAPETYRSEYNSDNEALLSYVKRLLKVWDTEYKRLVAKHGKDNVPDDMQPTWARAAKTIKANLGTPLDQVANGTQRQQIEKAGQLALEKLAARGIDVTMADMQALLWYPEKELWTSLTRKLNIDDDGVPIPIASNLNESYDAVFTRILGEQGYGIQAPEQIEGTGRAGTRRDGDQPSTEQLRDTRERIEGADGEVVRGIGTELQQAEAPLDEQMRSAGWLMQDYEQGVPAFYSALERFVEGVNQPKAPADQWKAMIAKAPGIKKEELEWTGIIDILENVSERGRADGKGDTITKEELLEILQGKGVVVETIVATNDGDGNSGLTFDEGEVWDAHEAWDWRVEDEKEMILDDQRADLEVEVVAQIARDEASYIKKNKREDEDVDDYIVREFSDEISEGVDELAQQRAETYARESYFEDPIRIYEAQGDLDEDIYIFGSDESGYSVRVGDWSHHSSVVASDIWSLSEAEIQAQDYAIENELIIGADGPNSAKWGEYVTDGDHKNYRELKLTLPDNPGEEFVYSSHYEDPNIVAFVRVTDRQMRAMPDRRERKDVEVEFRWEPWVGRAAQGDGVGRTGDVAVVVDGVTRKRIPSTPENRQKIIDGLASWSKPEYANYAVAQTITRFDDGTALKMQEGKVFTEIEDSGVTDTFYVEELQSDWHQQGRQGIYDTPEERARAKEMRRSAQNDVASKTQEVRQIFAEMEPDRGWMSQERGPNGRVFVLSDSLVLSKLHELAVVNPAPPDSRLISLNEKIQKLINLAIKAEDALTRDAVPDAPFKGDAWINLALKKSLMSAVEDGKKAFAWADSRVVKNRWSDVYAELYENIYDRKLVKFVRKLTKQKAVHYTLDGDLYTKEDAEDGVEGYWVIEITDELRDTIKSEGFPLFQSGGNPKGWGETAPPTDLPPMRLNLSAVREAYGEDAVRKLPHAVRKRAASSNDVNDMLQNVKSVRDALKAKPPASLFKFIRSKKVGGIKEGNQSAGDVRSIMDDNYSLINNKSGRDLDYVREMAEEAGYISSKTDEYGRTSIQDLLDALAKEAGGEPVYSEQDAEQANNYENAQRWKEWFEDNGVDVFEDSKPTLRKQVEALITSTSDGAVDADSAAEVFGFSSGEAMLAAMAEIGSRGKHVNAEAKRRMAEEFGDPFNDGSLAEKARLYAENEVRVRQTEIELAALNEALGQNAASNRAKEMARERLSEMTVKQVSRYNTFRDNEQRWSRAALEAVEKGDMTNAMIYKQRQLVNMHLYREGEKLSQKLDKVQRELRKYETVKSRRAKIAPDYMERIDDLLSAYELRISKQGRKEQERRASVAAWVSEMIAEGREAEIAPEASLLAEAADRKTWQSLTVDEASYLKATIENLAHLGKRHAQLLSDRDKREFNAVIDELVETLEAAGPLGGKLTPLPSREQSHRPTAGERVSGALRKSHAWLMRLEHQFRALDGKENGPLWNALFRIFADAADVESKMARASAKAVRAAYNIYTSRQRYVMHNVSIEIPELGKPIGQRWTKMDVISMALNWGVEYNRQALIEGYGWNAEQVEAALNRLMTNKDWDFVEAIWKESGRYKKEAFALEKAMTGVEPKAVEGITFTLPSGRVIKGQYYHLEYDGRQIGKASNRQRIQDEREALSNRMRSMSKPQTRNGALKERVGSGGKPVKLNISVFERSIMETIHDIAYRKAIIDASRIVTNDRFREAYQRTSGMEAYDQLMPWLETIATEKTDQVQGIASIGQTMRRNLPIAYMGIKISTASIQWTGVLAGIPEVGHRYFAQGVAKSFFGNPLSVFEAWQAVSEKSEFMRDRPMGYDRDVREITSQMGAANPLGDMKRNMFILISAMDIAVSTPLWTAGYDKALAGKVDGIERGNEDDAIAYADSLIRRTQTAGRNQDLARVSRDNEFWKMFTMIFGYFSNLFALLSQKVRALRSGQITPIDFAYFAVILFIAIPILSELSSGQLLADDDDDESLASKMGDAVISNFAGMFPVIRDMVNYKLKPEYGYNMSPVASGMEDAAQTMNALLETAFEGEEFTEADTKRAVRALGGIFGIPSSQIVITGDYIWDVMQGKEDPVEEPERIFTEGLLRNTN